MSTANIRWIQRFNNFSKAFKQLEDAINLATTRELTQLEQQGLIQAFEYTHELSWKTLKDFLKDRGTENIYGSKDATREAFKLGLIEDGDTWMNMIQSRNQTSHTYNQDAADEIFATIKNRYFLQFKVFQQKFQQMKEEEV